MNGRIDGMATDKATVTLDVVTLAAAREAARDAGLSLSAWLDRAARDKLRRDGAAALADYLTGPDGDELRDWMSATARARRDMPGMAV